MDCNNSTLRIVRGNDFSVRVKTLRAVKQEDGTTEYVQVELSKCSNIITRLVSRIGRRVELMYTIDGDELLVDFDGSLSSTVYGFEIVGKYEDGHDWRYYAKPGEFLEIVEPTSAASGLEGDGAVEPTGPLAWNAPVLSETLSAQQVEEMRAATDNANASAEAANTAADKASEAASKAEESAENANKIAENATQVTANANDAAATATEAANTAATIAEEAKAKAEEAATLVETTTANANAAANAANEAADKANKAASKAEESAGNANKMAEDATQAATNANDAATTATEAANNATTIANEAKATAEEAATLAETVTAKEQERDEAENKRAAAEEGRTTTEAARAKSEADRAAAESSRASAESARATAEDKRVSAESARATAEQGRVSAESSRANAESTRATAESGRASAESSRAKAETARASAESARATAEQKRVDAEAARVSAETKREAATTAAVTNCNETAAKVGAAVEGAEKVNADFVDGKIVITNRDGEQKTVDSKDMKETVNVTITSDVAGVALSGVTLNVYLNHGGTPQQYVTDASGKVSFDVAWGNYYEIVFPDKVGCKHVDPIGYTATIGSRDITVDYEEYTAEESEAVTVTVTKRQDGESIPWAGATVHVKIGTATTDYTTDESGNVNFTVELNTQYTVSMDSDVNGWYTHKQDYVKTYTAKAITRQVWFTWYPYRTGVFIVGTDGVEYTEEEWDASGLDASEAQLIKCVTESLVSGSGVIYVPLDDIVAQAYPNKQWSIPQWNIAGIPNNQASENYFNGVVSTDLILASAEEQGGEVPAADYCRSQSITNGGVAMTGYLGSVGQWQQLWLNRDGVDAWIKKIKGEDATLFSTFTKNKWTSTQNGAANAMYFGSSAAYNGKAGGSAAVPFFAY